MKLFAPLSSCPLGSKNLHVLPPDPGNERGIWMKREEGAGARPGLSQGGGRQKRGAGPEAEGSPHLTLLWVVCRNPGEGSAFLGAQCGGSHCSCVDFGGWSTQLTLGHTCFLVCSFVCLFVFVSPLGDDYYPHLPPEAPGAQSGEVTHIRPQTVWSNWD